MSLLKKLLITALAMLIVLSIISQAIVAWHLKKEWEQNHKDVPAELNDVSVQDRDNLPKTTKDLLNTLDPISFMR